jgi:Putative metal-binding motif
MSRVSMHRRLVAEVIAGAMTILVAAGCGDLIPPGHGHDNDAGTPPSTRRIDGGQCGVGDLQRTVERDFDGDGVFATWIEHCDEWWPAVSDSSTDDCDDTDPARTKRGWRDADGDGVTQAVSECFAAVPAGYGNRPSKPSDCDDSDASRQQTIYVDVDGDGYGGKDQTECVAAFDPRATLPEGRTRDALDCDDADPTRNPRGFEQWNDGIDSNCDGRDAPLDCVDGECGCQLLTVAPPIVDPSCNGPDLFVVKNIVCMRCGYFNVLIVGNRGTVAAQGGFALEADGDAVARTVKEDLAPGALGHPFILPPGLASVRIVPLASECDVSNNVQVLGLPPGGCAD